MNYAYVRVSTKEQSEARQIECLKKYGIDKWYSEKVSGATMDRPKLQEMLRELNRGDTVYISDFSRLARNTYDLLMMIENFEHYGINLVSDKERLDMSTASGKLLITAIAVASNFERDMMVERHYECPHCGFRRHWIYENIKPGNLGYEEGRGRYDKYWKYWNDCLGTILGHL